MDVVETVIRSLAHENVALVHDVITISCLIIDGFEFEEQLYDLFERNVIEYVHVEAPYFVEDEYYCSKTDSGVLLNAFKVRK